jgi:hypothetical protein
MKHNLIKTDNYLLVVDDSEIKQSDWIYNEEREPSIVQCIGKGSLRGWAKIIAYLPLNGAPVLDGVPLLPSLPQEDDKEKYKYTEEDIRAIKRILIYDDDKNDEEKISEVIRVIESLQHRPKLPIAFECEVITRVYDVYPQRTERKPKTITNSEGRTEWVGKYIYE